MNRKQLGAYYTPNKITQPLADWAIRTGGEYVIDPTFGGCSFIQSALHRGRKIGSIDFLDNIFGCDLDPIAFEHLRKAIGKYRKDNFLFCDFLDFKSDLKFDVVLGNPPYIKHDNIPDLALEKAQSATSSFPEIGQLVRPNYWAYFVIHCLSILKPNGRMALVLPLTFLNSQYSEILRGFLTSHFARIDVFPIKEKVFEGTEENTLVALFEDYSIDPTEGLFVTHESTSISELQRVLRTDRYKNTKSGRNTLEDEISDFFDSVIEFQDLSRIDKLFDIKIGIVTGAKSYFVLSKEEADRNNLSGEFLVPVISKAEEMKSLHIDSAQVDNFPLLLVLPQDYAVGGLYSNPHIDRYLLSAPKSVLETYHSRHRKPWFSLRNVYPSAFYLKNVNSNHVILHRNDARLLATNNILRLIPNSDRNVQNSSLFSLSSIFQLSAFSSGIRYGKKALKIDPQHAGKILLPHLDIVENADVAAVQKLYLDFDFHKASDYVDQLISERLFTNNTNILKECKKLLKALLKRDFQ